MKAQGQGDSAAGRDAEELLEELSLLASSAGAEVVASVLQRRDRPEAATLIGAGKAEELKLLASERHSDACIFDRELSPTQQRNLEKLLGIKVIDRTQLILDIFARRARTREGQLQVELAQLNYMLPRLAGRGIEMSRLGGGIGTRGPGETQLETDRRRIHTRIRKIKGDLERVRSSRQTQRKQRSAVPLATIALVGYTNAGKSTLFNRLTGAGVLADQRLFATLDPTVRAIALPSHRRVLVSDTVGFIRNLPTTLVEAFRATLEEVTEAALILHVVDASSDEAAAHVSHVDTVLTEIGATGAPRILVLNKADLLPDAGAALAHLDIGPPDASTERTLVSARTGDGIGELLAAIDRILPFDPVVHASFRFPIAETRYLHVLHELARVVATRFSDESFEVDAEVPQSVRDRLTAYLLEG